MKFKIIGKCIFLVENEDISSSFENKKATVKVSEINLEEYEIPRLVVCDGNNNHQCLEQNGMELTVENNSNYTITLFDDSPGEQPIATGRFSVISGVVCYNPDVVPLEFVNIKDAMITLSNRLDELESKTGEVQETLNGYTTE